MRSALVLGALQNKHASVKMLAVTFPKIPAILIDLINYFSSFEIREVGLVLMSLFSLTSNIKYHFFPGW